MPRQPAARQHHNNYNNHHQQQQQQHQQHQQPGTSFGASSDSSTSYLSSRSRVQSPRSNFNPFSPLSPDLAEKELGEVDDDSGAMFQMEDTGNAVSRASRVYSRAQLLVVARDGREKGWVKPAGMAPLESWFGVLPQPQDPAIASIGNAPNRRNGGFGEGFGYGGGIGGKGLNRGGRHAGPRRNDQEGHGSAGPSKEMSGGPMGKFAVRTTQDRLKLGGDENRKPKDDWRRDKPPHQAQRSENRQWNNYQEEDTAEPAWMEDQPEHDPAIAHIQDDALHQFVPVEDKIAAHKRAMRAGNEGSERKPLVGFFNTEQPVQAPTKPIKEYNAANYLLPKKRVEPEASSSKETTTSSRFARFFGNPAQPEEPASSVLSPPPRSAPSVSPTPPPPSIDPGRNMEDAAPCQPSAPPTQSPPPPDDRQASLMRELLMGNSSGGRTSAARRHSPPPIPDFLHQAGFPPQLMPLGLHPTYSAPPQPPGPSPWPPVPSAAPNHLHHLQHQQGFLPPHQIPPQQTVYAPPPPFPFHHQYQQGFLPPTGRPPYQPPPPIFAPEPPRYNPNIPGQPLYQHQHPQDQQQRNMNALLNHNQWYSSPR